MSKRPLSSERRVRALFDIGKAMIDMGEGVLRLAAAEQDAEHDAEQDEEVATGAPTPLDVREVQTLWGRLGSGNRQLLLACAARFQPGEQFTLEDMADAAGASTGTVRARLMNIGRSLKSMGNDFTVLWDTEMGLVNLMYTWRPDAHRVISSKAP